MTGAGPDRRRREGTELLELDVVRLLAAVDGVDADGEPRSFVAGPIGTIVIAGALDTPVYVDVVRLSGPDWPADGFAGETEGFFWATPGQLAIVHRDRTRGSRLTGEKTP
jgi:hypothetical protein